MKNKFNTFLNPGKAALKKKLKDKLNVIEADDKALKTAVFIEETSMFDSIFNHFEDARGWHWFQIGKNENV